MAESRNFNCHVGKIKCERKDKESSSESMLNETSKGATAKTSSHDVLLPSTIKLRRLFCDVCSIQFNFLDQLSKHLNNPDHIFKYESDKRRQWNFRPPPWNKDVASLQLCSLKDCPYSKVSAFFNYCENAHSRRELSEWRERHEWRDLMTKMKRDEDASKYLEGLQNMFFQYSGVSDIFCEEMNGVEITCNRNLTAVSRKATDMIWIFTIRTREEIQLKNICLLLNQDRSRFGLVSPTDKACVQFLRLPNDGHKMTHIEVAFNSPKRGFFKQLVLFDFESERKIVRKLSVETPDNPSRGTNGDNKAKKSENIVWTESNREIIRDARISHSTLMPPQWWRYKPPDDDEDICLNNDRNFPLNRHNYQHKCHRLIANEELSRRRIFSRFNLCTNVSILDRIEEETYVYAQNGELYAKITLDEDLSMDTDEGQLFLENVNSALIAVQHPNNNRVYEARLATIDKFDKRGKNYIYLDIPPESVKYLDLQPNTDVILQIQFQMNRDTFRNMHYAVDSLSNTGVVFPDISKLNALNWNERKVNFTSKKFNISQVQAIRHIITKKDHWPPLLVYGPFGTGKTETLAEATKYLLARRPDSRILICAFNNSSADIYLTKFLGPFLQDKGKQHSALRVYHPDRRYNTIPTECHPYMLYSDETNTFHIPTKEDIMKKAVVVTTLETAVYLIIQNLQGMFTHIFIDEAAQAFECLVWIPLSLADDRTCVVLTGDHRQMNPKAYSAEAKRQKFCYSIIQRLYEYYENYCHTESFGFSNVAIFLNENYRSHKVLLRFLSETFYGSGDNLICRSNVPNVCFQPIYFFSAFGQEMKLQDSTSVFNEHEANCIAENVSYIYEHWPEEWGERKEEAIQVIAAYQEQVALIRAILRSKRLKKIKVNTVYVIQGLECRVLFISTVRAEELWQSRNLKRSIESDDYSMLGKYGFLSNPNMLNTALTRAISTVFVVGDPIALCTIGECKDIWKKYIKQCYDKQSYAGELNYDDLKTLVEKVESTPDGLKVKQLSEQSYSAMLSYQTKTEAADKPSFFAKLLTAYSKKEKEEVTGKTNTNLQNPSLRKVSEDNDNWDGFQMKQDEIIQRLGEEPLCRQMDLDADMGNCQKNPRFLVKEKGGTEAHRRLVSAADVTDVMDYSSGEEEIEGGEFGKGLIRKEYNKTKLHTLLQENPNKYKRCYISIADEIQFAISSDLRSDIKKIYFRTRENCGRAFNNDEVVVEILPEPETTPTVTDGQENVQVHGLVVGILNRAVKPRFKQFVCRTNPTDTRLMLPLNENIPPIYNYLPRRGRHKPGKVSVYRFQDDQIKFVKNEPIDPVNQFSRLFMVQLLKWSRNKRFPLGVVTRVLPVGDNLENGLLIIENEHQIARGYDEKATKDVDRLNIDSTEQEMKHRTNLIDNTNCFTIDNTFSEVFDDALSYEALENDECRIGIHIADVTHFIDKDCDIDKAAFKRPVSYYRTGREPVHMLPTTLASECSLTQEKNKLAISIFLTVNKTGEILNCEFYKSVVQCRRNFTYDEVQKILTTNSDEDELSWSVKQMYRVSRNWRKWRIGKAYCYNDLNPANASSASAHVFVEEMMIMANSQVANLLSEKYPDYFPLRVHQAPNVYSLFDWRRKNYNAVANVVSLNTAFKDSEHVCRCQSECTCVSQFISKNDLRSNDDVTIAIDHLESLFSAADRNDFETFTQLLLSPQKYPDSAVALAEYRKLQNRALYTCGHDTDDKSLHRHFGLKLPVYVHFTSPIRRYFDIAVHRMVSAFISETPNPYSEDELKDIARQCNIENQTEINYYNDIMSLQFSDAIKTKPVVCYAVIEKVCLEAIHLVFPSFNFLQDAQRKIPMAHLFPSHMPELDMDEITDDKVVIELQWRERIYNLEKGQTPTNEIQDQSSTKNIPRKDWQRLLDCVCDENFKSTKEMLNKIRSRISETQTVELHTEIQNTYPDSEKKCYKSKDRLFTKFYKKFERYQRLRVQLNGILHKGILVPEIQLYFLTPKLAICVQHRRHPVECFCILASKQASCTKYKDLEEYADLWQPVIAMETATTSVKSREQIFIHNVTVKWKPTQVAKKLWRMTGTFRLPFDFCYDKDINLIEDYICVRYNDMIVKQDSELNDEISCIVNGDNHVVFICHCIIEKVLRKGSDYICTMRLFEYTMAFPDCLLKDEDNTCTMEIIPKSLPQRRIQRAIEKIKESKAPQFTNLVAMGKVNTDLDNYPGDIEELTTKRLVGIRLNPLNDLQLTATKNALRRKFTLIQGPPGTGKTVTGVYLAMYFCKRNEAFDDHYHVLYCGPSNKSMDVVTEKLLDFGKECPSIVRVYGERIENDEFPLPRSSIPSTKSSYSKVSNNPMVKNRALHKLIRLGNRTFCNKIKLYDRLFELVCNGQLTEDCVQVVFEKMKGNHTNKEKTVREVMVILSNMDEQSADIGERENMNSEETVRKVMDILSNMNVLQEQSDDIIGELIKKYKKTVNEAKKIELNRHSVILTTCIASGAPMLENFTNIRQIIIDEAAMCTEPESMIPLSNFEAENIVLIGDHMQLQPVVIEQKARFLGLGKSLFERYCNKAFMLEVQYRMHEGIMAFPSKQFYEGKLKCGTDRQKGNADLDIWPGGRKNPCVLCHAEGEELTLTVATEEGSVLSKSNMMEVKYSVKVASNLVRRWGRACGDIAILSQYRAQCSAIRKQLAKENLADIQVSTVVSSQGSEWKYVILSTVRSLPKLTIETSPSKGWTRGKLGSIANDNQMNVALTRARDGLIIIGNKHLLECNQTWRNLIEDYYQRGLIVDAERSHLCT